MHVGKASGVGVMYVVNSCCYLHVFCLLDFTNYYLLKYLYSFDLYVQVFEVGPAPFFSLFFGGGIGHRKL